MDLFSRRIVGWNFLEETGDYENSFHARRELFEYICFDNQQRKHSSLGCVTPAEFETQQTVQN